uniref:Mediator of RNA polymerase II transcription subunit 4 n=1 Tax=Arcella intermedia TaxID=1963864 RepID=A0A6B2LGX5_9EUKA|eukprot:TRINITY_DN2474_c0_g1_i1.p1 TRINITY_DN2474_c0_g1~~TRINITY_DN2474_c0_g1_i1.p1  ORF type:complete len:227 (-),score=49.85 TRINITY_DN2474_c0_g1_i1:115-795(-)
MSVSKKAASDALGDFSRLTHELMNTFVCMSEGRETQSDPQSIMLQIISLDQQLQNAVKKLQEEQKFYAEIENLNKKIKEKDNQIAELTKLLRGVERNLQNVLDTSEENIKSIQRSIKNQVSVEDLIVYAHRVSYVMGESPFEPTQPESLFYKPPFPETYDIQQTYMYSGSDLVKKEEEKANVEPEMTLNEPSWFSFRRHEEEIDKVHEIKKETKSGGGLFDDLDDL